MVDTVWNTHAFAFRGITCKLLVMLLRRGHVIWPAIATAENGEVDARILNGIPVDLPLVLRHVDAFGDGMGNERAI